MNKLKWIAVLITFTGGFSSVASAQDSNFEVEFVNRTILGNWHPGANATSDDKPNVAASLDEFADSIWGKYPRLTEEQHGLGKATAELFTNQFK